MTVFRDRAARETPMTVFRDTERRLERVEKATPPPRPPETYDFVLRAKLNLYGVMSLATHGGLSGIDGLDAGWSRVRAAVAGERPCPLSDAVVAALGAIRVVENDPVAGVAEYAKSDRTNAEFPGIWWLNHVINKRRFPGAVLRALDAAPAWLHAVAGCNKSREILKLPRRPNADDLGAHWPNVSGIEFDVSSGQLFGDSAFKTRPHVFSVDEASFLLDLCGGEVSGYVRAWSVGRSAA
jgi:hypothetical protein